jgi:hypothetical protein
MDRWWKWRDIDARLELGSDARVGSTGIVSVKNSSLDWRRWYHILGYMGWTEVWTASLSAKLGFHVNTCRMLTHDLSSLRIMVRVSSS